MSLSTFRVRFPEFSETEDSVVELFLADAAQEIGADIFLGRYERALDTLAAHYLQLQTAKINGLNNNIKSKSIGDVSVSYGDASTMGFAATGYGVAFMELLKIVAPAVVVV